LYNKIELNICKIDKYFITFVKNTNIYTYYAKGKKFFQWHKIRLFYAVRMFNIVDLHDFVQQ